MSIWGGKETGGFGVSRNVSQWRYSFKIFSIGTYREENTIYSRIRNEISINGMRGWSLVPGMEETAAEKKRGTMILKTMILKRKRKPSFFFAGGIVL